MRAVPVLAVLIWRPLLAVGILVKAAFLLFSLGDLFRCFPFIRIGRAHEFDSVFRSVIEVPEKQEDVVEYNRYDNRYL